MSEPSSGHPSPNGREQSGSLLELITAAVLVLVLAALAWMVAAAYWPGQFRLASIEVEVVTVSALLTAALLLVSVVALLHTRD